MSCAFSRANYGPSFFQEHLSPITAPAGSILAFRVQKPRTSPLAPEPRPERDQTLTVRR